MSGSTTSQPPIADRSLGEFRVDTEDGAASVKVLGSGSTPKRVDVELASGRRWIFGVNENAAALVLVLNSLGGRAQEQTVPSWMEPVIQRTGLEGIDA